MNHRESPEFHNRDAESKRVDKNCVPDIHTEARNIALLSKEIMNCQSPQGRHNMSTMAADHPDHEVVGFTD